MKRLLLLIFGILCLYSLNAQCSLTIEITGIKRIKGNLYIALFDSKEAYDHNRYKGKMIKVEAHKSKILFEDIIAGEYAVSVFQDENENGRLDTKIFGIPAEKYGYSNNVNAFKLRRRPTFDECKFEIKEDTTISIQLR